MPTMPAIDVAVAVLLALAAGEVALGVEVLPRVRLGPGQGAAPPQAHERAQRARPDLVMAHGEAMSSGRLRVCSHRSACFTTWPT